MRPKTFYHIILDQSGSMMTCLYPTISGFNEQVQMVKSLQERYPGQEITLGLTQFNTQVKIPFIAQAARYAKLLNTENYRPDGGTALYDAIGYTIKELSRKLHHDLREPNTSVVVVILTDGYENSSRKYDHAAISSTIKELEATGKWTFSYLGATPDAVEVATKLNIKRDNSMSFDIREMNKTYEMVQESMVSYMDIKAKGEKNYSFLKKNK